MNELISRTPMRTCYPHESPNSTGSVLLLIEVEGSLTLAKLGCRVPLQFHCRLHKAGSLKVLA